MKLDIGAGGKSQLGPEWIAVDAYVAAADLNAPMHCIPLESGSVEEIYSGHALEHVGIREVDGVLREWFRLLEHGGKMTLLLPDLQWCCIQWLANQTRGFEMERLFGNQWHEGEYHKTGFTAPMIGGMLAHVGFVVDSISYVDSHRQQCMLIRCHKPGGAKD